MRWREGQCTERSEGNEQDDGYDGERRSQENSRAADLDGTRSGLEGKDGDSLRKKLHGGVHTGDLVRWITRKCKQRFYSCIKCMERIHVGYIKSMERNKRKLFTPGETQL